MSARAVKRDGSGISPGRTSQRRHAFECPSETTSSRGIESDFRELLCRAGLAIDAVGVSWTILSGFRDDYRQGWRPATRPASTTGCMGQHRGRGYGHGCAVDVPTPSTSRTRFGNGSMPTDSVVGLDPVFGVPSRLRSGPRPAARAWHELAEAVRHERLAVPRHRTVPGSSIGRLLQSAAPSETNANCIDAHRGRGDTRRIRRKPRPPGFELAAAARGPKTAAAPKAAAKSVARHAVHAAPHDAGTS